MIFLFVSLQRPEHLLKIWRRCEAKTSRAMKGICPMLLIFFGRLDMKQLLGADRLHLLLPYLSKTSRLETLCKTYRLKNSAGHYYCIVLIRLPL